MQDIAAEKKEEVERGGRKVGTHLSGISSQPWCTPQGRAAVKRKEREVIVCAVMRLDLGFRKVWREKGGMLTRDQNSHIYVDLITYERD